MNLFLAHWVRLSGIALLALGWATESVAITVSLDQFTVQRGTATFFNDTFSDGAPPPSAPNFVTGAAASYNVNGTIAAGAEAGGLLQLDSANGAATENAAGFSRLTVISTLLTSTTGGATQLGVGDVLALTGTFGLAVPTGPLFSAYGIRFSDSANNVTHQTAQLFVRYNDVVGQAQIAYVLQDFDADTITTFGATALAAPGGADQIRLTISRPNTANNNFLGSFAYLAGGLVVGSGGFDVPAALFQGEDFVRAQFFVAETIPTPVPEPEIFLLMGVGGAFAFIARRRRLATR